MLSEAKYLITWNLKNFLPTDQNDRDIDFVLRESSIFLLNIVKPLKIIRKRKMALLPHKHNA